jgi:hypothetical protein
VYWGSGGDLLGVDGDLLDTVDILHTGLHGREYLRSIEPPEGTLRGLAHFPDRGGAESTCLNRLAAIVRRRTHAS